MKQANNNNERNFFRIQKQDKNKYIYLCIMSSKIYPIDHVKQIERSRARIKELEFIHI